MRCAHDYGGTSFIGVYYDYVFITHNFFNIRCSSFVRLLLGGFAVLKMTMQSCLIASFSTSGKHHMLSSISQMMVSVGMLLRAMAKFRAFRRVLASVLLSAC